MFLLFFFIYIKTTPIFLQSINTNNETSGSIKRNKHYIDCKQCDCSILGQLSFNFPHNSVLFCFVLVTVCICFFFILLSNTNNANEIVSIEIDERKRRKRRRINEWINEWISILISMRQTFVVEPQLRCRKLFCIVLYMENLKKKKQISTYYSDVNSKKKVIASTWKVIQIHWIHD